MVQYFALLAFVVCIVYFNGKWKVYIPVPSLENWGKTHPDRYVEPKQSDICTLNMAGGKVIVGIGTSIDTVNVSNGILDFSDNVPMLIAERVNTFESGILKVELKLVSASDGKFYTIGNHVGGLIKLPKLTHNPRLPCVG